MDKGLPKTMTPGEPIREHYREQGRKQERERIIKLLEQQLRTIQVKRYPEWTWQTNAEIIALIKGEK